MTNRIEVLLIDDDKQSSDGIADYLRRLAQFSVRTYRSGAEALAHLSTLASPEEVYTAVLLDYTLSAHFPGQKVLDQIHSQSPCLPVVVFTGLDPAGGLRALEQGAYRYLRRPLDYVELINIVRSLAEQDRVYHELVQDIRQLLGSALCLAWRLDKKANCFRIAAWEGDAGLNEEFRQSAALDATSPALRTFVERGEPAFFADVSNPTKAPHYQYREQVTQFGWCSLFSIPLFRNKRVIGIIDSYTLTPYQFRDNQQKRFILSALQIWSKQAAEAIQKAEQSKRSQKLQAISELIAGLHDEKTIIRQILSNAVALVGADSGWLYLLDFQTNQLIRKDFEGIAAELVDEQRAIGKDVTGWTASEGVTAFVPDTGDDKRHRPIPAVAIAAEIAVPLRRNEQTIGVLTVHSRHKEFFTDEDIRFLLALATRAAIAITHAKLTRHLQEISQLSLIGDYAQLTAYVVNAMQDLTAANVSLWRVQDVENGTKQSLQVVAFQGDFPASYAQKQETISLEPNDSLTAQALLLRKADLRKDIQDKVETPIFYDRNHAIQQDWHSFMTMPLLGREHERLGVLNLYSTAIAKFSQADIDLIQPFVNQVAIALQQQWRAAALQRLVTTGETLTGSITAQSNLMNQVAEAACDLIQAHCAAIYPYDPVRHDFYEQSLIGVARVLHQNKKFVHKPRRRGLVEKVRQQGELIVHDIEQGEIAEFSTNSQGQIGEREQVRQQIFEMIKQEGFIAREAIKSFMAISLIANQEDPISNAQEEREVGVLYVNFRCPHHFTQEEIQLIRIYAHQVANLIRSARLYLEASRQANELEALRQTMLNIVAKKDQASLLNALIAEMTKLFKVKGGAVYLRTPGPNGLELVAAQGVTDEQLQLGMQTRVGIDLVEQLLDRKQSAFVNQLDPIANRVDGQESSFSAVMAAPLLLGNEVIGVIGVLAVDQEHTFSEADQPVIERFAQQAALVIHNIRLYEGAQRRIRDMELVNQGVQIIGTTLQTDDLLEATVTQIVETLKCTHCTIFFPVVEEHKTLLVPRKSYGLHAEQIMQRRFQADEGIVGKVFQTGKSIRSEDARFHPAFAKATRDLVLPRSMLAVPITVGEQTIGVITTDQDVYGWFTENDQQLLEALARHVGIATERATAFEQLQQISLQITSASDIRTILARIAEGALKITNSSSCAIYLLSDDQQSITELFQFPADVGHPMPRLREKKGLTYAVVNTGDEIAIHDVAQDSRVNPHLASQIKSIILLPLKLAEKVIGVMYLNDKNEHKFREPERILLRTLASQAVLSMQKARLLEQERQAKAQAETLREISSAISQDLNIDKTLRLIVENAIKLTHADGGIVHLIDPLTQRLVQNIAEPPTFHNFPTRFEQKSGFIWDIYQGGHTNVIDDLTISPYATGPLLQTQVRSMIGLPLKQRTEIIGVLCLKSYQKDHFREDQTKLLPVLVEQAALAIERAQRYEQRVKDISSLETINEAILQKNFAEVTQLIVKEAKKLTKATTCRLRLLDPSKQILREVATDGTPSHLPEVHKDTDSITGNVALHGKAEIYLDMQQYPYPIKLKAAESCMCVPLLYNKEVIGTLYAESTQAGVFLSEQIQVELLQALANQAAIAIVTTQQYQQRIQDIAALQEINQAVVSKSQTEILKLVQRKARQVMDCEYCTLWLIDSSNGDLILEGVDSQEESNIEPGKRIKRTEHSINAYVAETGKSYICRDTENDSRFLRHYQAAKSSLTVPLTYQGKMIGTLNVESSELNAFQKDAQLLLESFADQVAIAIETAQLYEEMEKRIEKIRYEAHQNTEETFQLMLISEMGAQFAHRLNNLIGHIPPRIELAKEELDAQNRRDAKVIQFLDAVTDDVRYILRTARQTSGTFMNKSRQMEYINFRQLSDEVIQNFRKINPELHSSIQLINKLDSAMPEVYLDKDGLIETLHNMIQNGLDAMKDGGSLTISSIYQGLSHIEISISDTGCGISEEIQPKIFELGFSTKKGGLGFGLWHDRNYFRRFGGDIELMESQVGKGTTFKIRIPIESEYPYARKR